MYQKQAAYPTDLNDNQWKLICPYIPEATTGRRRKHSIREMLNAIFYVLRGGIAWRMLPKNFPPWRSVYTQFWRWRQAGVWQRVSDALVARARKRSGRQACPSKVIIDSQSIKTREGGQALGVDKFKRINGRKRHIVVDTFGFILMVVVHSASELDEKAGWHLLQRLFDHFMHCVYPGCCRLKIVRADGGYEHIVQSVKAAWGWTMEVIKRAPDAKGFQLLPKRWVVERTFAWLGKFRRLSKDYERTTASSEAMIYIANICLILRRLAPSEPV